MDMKNEVLLEIPDFVKNAIQDCTKKGVLPTGSQFESYQRGKSCEYVSASQYFSSGHYSNVNVTFNDSYKGHVSIFVNLYANKPLSEEDDLDGSGRVDTGKVDSLPCTVELKDDGLTFKVNIM